MIISGDNLILTDSVGRDLPSYMPNQDCQVISLSGFTVDRLNMFVNDYPQLIESRKVILLHIGTNDVGSKANFNSFMSFKLHKSSKPPSYSYDITTSKFNFMYRELIISIISINSSAHILFSPIIFRPYDYSASRELIMQINREIKLISSKGSRYDYLYTWKSFWDKVDKVPKEKCFLERDQLHLSEEGTQILRDFFCGAISRHTKSVL